MLPVFIMAIENDDDRTFVAELYARCQPAMQPARTFYLEKRE